MEDPPPLFFVASSSDQLCHTPDTSSTGLGLLNAILWLGVAAVAFSTEREHARCSTPEHKLKWESGGGRRLLFWPKRAWIASLLISGERELFDTKYLDWGHPLTLKAENLGRIVSFQFIDRDFTLSNFRFPIEIPVRHYCRGFAGSVTPCLLLFYPI